MVFVLCSMMPLFFFALDVGMLFFFSNEEINSTLNAVGHYHIFDFHIMTFCSMR
jgi:hypothetical protein